MDMADHVPSSLSALCNLGALLSHMLSSSDTAVSCTHMLSSSDTAWLVVCPQH